MSNTRTGVSNTHPGGEAEAGHVSDDEAVVDQVCPIPTRVCIIRNEVCLTLTGGV